MPKDDSTSRASMTQHAGGPPAASWSQQTQSSIFRIPAPLKRVFDRFPLVQYDENDLPLRAPKERGQHVLHVFTTEKDAKDGRPSFNPGCLKWQAYLNFSGIEHRLVPSSNHGSPSGILPFLQPAVPSKESKDAPAAVPSNKLTKWTKTQSSTSVEESEDLRYEAYASLINNALRKAWVCLANRPESNHANSNQLYQLYLHPANSALVHSLYVAPCSSNSFVQIAISHQLREAAESELAKASFSSTISEADIMRDAASALSALSELLGQEQWFFGQKQPSMLDASIFAYTHLILDESLQWGENELARQVSQHQNLVAHRERILNQFF